MKDENNAVFVPLCCGREEGGKGEERCLRTVNQAARRGIVPREGADHVPEGYSWQTTTSRLVATFVDTNH